MINLFAKPTLNIGAGRAVSGRVSTKQILQVVYGKVWITIEGLPEDHWLSAGESVQLVPGRLLVIEAADEDSRVRIPKSARHKVLSTLQRLLASVKLGALGVFAKQRLRNARHPSIDNKARG